MIILKRLVLILSLTVFANVLALDAANAELKTVYKAHTQVELVPQYNTVLDAQSFTVGVRFKTDDEWHIYWRNPGDSGLQPKIQWELPNGFRAGEFDWPYPERIDAPPLVSYGYDGETFLKLPMTAASYKKKGESIPFKAKVSWLACKVECVPGIAHFSFSIPIVKDKPTLNPLYMQLYDRTKVKYPLGDPFGKYTVWQTPEDFIIKYIPTDLIDGIEEGYFFPYDANMIDYTDQQKFKRIPDGYEYVIKQADLYDDQANNRLKGIFVFHKKGYEPIRPVEVDIPIQLQPVELASAGAVTSVRLWLGILFAFLGGVILNLMPCVLPVLSIKVLSLVEKSRTDKSDIFGQGIQFTLGILVSFWVLAGGMLLLRHAGHQIGWGFQFQSPLFVVLMTVLFFVLSLNLFGLFEIGVSLTRVKSSNVSFLNGVLATIVATPCTAPFMGSAIGLTLSQPAWYTFIVFTALGLGMAFPYLLLTRYPKFLKYVPKPGLWMDQLKQFFGFVLMAVVVWLIWVLSLQKSVGAVIVVLIGLLFIAFACWIGRIKKRKDIVMALAGIFLLIGAVFCYQAIKYPAAAAGNSEGEKASGIAWQDYSSELLDKHLSSDKPIFLDFTAAWCLSCQVNDRVVFNHPKVVQRFKQLGIIPVKADWTNHDAAITQAINGYGKNSIPLYVFYGKDKRVPPLILPELITPNLVLSAISDHLDE